MGFETNRRRTYGKTVEGELQVRALSTDHTAERKIEREIHRDTALKTMTMFNGRLREGEGASQRQREVMNVILGIS